MTLLTSLPILLLTLSSSSTSTAMTSLSSECSANSCRPITCVLVSVCLREGVYAPFFEEERQRKRREEMGIRGEVLKVMALNVSNKCNKCNKCTKCEQ